MNAIIGSCLCEAVQFEIMPLEDAFSGYQCHCTICQKVTGSAFSTGLFISNQQFKWLSGEDNISVYEKSSGYKNHFCKTCGCTVPNEFRGKPLMYLPAGSLSHGVSAEDQLLLEIKVQLHLSSRASWDKDRLTGCFYAEMPPLTELFELLHLPE